MHVKYALRHALYPVPNVSDCNVVAVVAVRAGREMFLCSDVVLRLVVRVAVAVRDVFVVRVDRAGTVFVPPVVAWAEVARDVVVVVVLAIVWRGVADERETVLFMPVRVMDFSLRTAALAMPTLTIYAIIKVKIRFIP